MNWRRPLYILFISASVALLIAAVSTTYWMEKDTSHGQHHFGLFESCVGPRCSGYKNGNSITWSLKVKALAVSSIIVALIALILALLRMFFKERIKKFISPSLMLLSTILAFSMGGVYAKDEGYVKGSDHDSVITGLSYGWSFIIAWVASFCSLFTSFFGFYVDFVDAFGSSGQQFQAKRLEEV